MTFASKYAPKGKSGNFITQIIRDKAMICVLYCPEKGSIDEAWYVIEVDSGKGKEFKQRLEQPGPITFTDYGIILHSGWGKEPPAHLKAQLREKYGLFEN